MDIRHELDLTAFALEDAATARCCKKCLIAYVDEEGSDEFGTGLCYECFESSLEEFEERRRERIARENEY